MIKYALFLLFSLVLFSSFVFAAVIVETEVVNDAIVPALHERATYILTLTNNGSRDVFHFYNLLGFPMAPTESFALDFGESKKINFTIDQKMGVETGKIYHIIYYIQGERSGDQEQLLTFKVLDLSDVFALSAADVAVGDNAAQITLENKEGIAFDSMQVHFSSDLFEASRELTFTPHEKKTLSIPIAKETARTLLAGVYAMKAEISVADQKTNVQGVVRFVEQSAITNEEQHRGFFMQQYIITRTNTGNVLATTSVVVQKNIFTRLLASFSPEPNRVERQGSSVIYTWTRELAPGASASFVTKTNWFFPFLLLVFVLGVVFAVSRLSRSPLALRKETHFVRVKGGEFALRVRIVLQAHSFLDNVTVSDHLPALVQLYDQFSHEKPNYDHKTRRLQWHFSHLDRGEMKVLSYIVYSKVGVLGKFILPAASASFEKGGQMQHAHSNKAFFMTEQIQKE